MSDTYSPSRETTEGRVYNVSGGDWDTVLGGQDFEVVAVNIDTRNPEKAKAWLTDTGIASLGHYADNSARIFQVLKEKGRAFGMPTTILVDKNGCEVATLAGPAEWASGDAMTFIKTALSR